MLTTEKATQFAEAVAKDNTHGYSQLNRWGNPDYDCSGLVITAYENAGTGVKTKGATYTGNMRDVFLKCGFEDVTTKDTISLVTGKGLQRGDVLLNTAKHTAIYCGNGVIVHACHDEKGGVKGTTKGDNTGGEICTRSYYNYPWNCVLRYTADNKTSKVAKATTNQTPAQSVKTANTATKDTTKHKYTVNTKSGLNVRKQANTTSAIVGTVANGTTLTIDKYNASKTWGYVKKLAGWVCLKYCKQA